MKRLAYNLLRKATGPRPFAVIDQLKINSGLCLIESISARVTRPVPLAERETRVFSQWGEDGILHFLARELGLSRPRILELGAGNYLECNSRFLVEALNGSAYCVDGRKDLETTMKSLDSYWRHSIWGQQTWITPDRVSEIFAGAVETMGQPDIVSLDIDGNDYWVLEEAPLDSVKVVVVEYNPIFGPRDNVSVPRNDGFERSREHYSHLYWGASLGAFVYLMESRGFRFIGSNRAGNNAFFVKNAQVANLSNLELPSTDLSLYTDWRVRESRDKSGKLNFLSLEEAREEIEDLRVVNVETNESLVLSEVFRKLR